MANFGPDTLARFTAAGHSAAAKLLDAFQELDLRKRPACARLPDFIKEASPEGSRLRLLVDCESGDPRHWMEVGRDWQVHGRGEPTEPVDLTANDVILRPQSSPAPGADPHAGPHEPLVALINPWIGECKAGRAAAGRARDVELANRLAREFLELQDARTLLRVLGSADVTAIERAITIPYYQCGYYDCHLAIDMASPDWSRWLEVKRDGTLCPLGEARGQEFDIFSGHIVLRPAAQ